MDLLQSVRKEGSRGGVNFSWDDVKNSQHRENYLGHSLMAPVGRWQKNKDLGWYAKAGDAELTAEEKAEKEREAKREELKKIKQAEEDAMARALGLPVPDRSSANEEPLGMSRERQQEVNDALKEALGDNEVDEDERGLGHGGVRRDREMGTFGGSRQRDVGRRDRTRGYDETKRRRRSGSRDRSRDRRHRHSHRESARSRSRDQRNRSRSKERHRDDDRYRRRRTNDERSLSRERNRRQYRRRSRSRSPYEARQHRRDR